MTTGQKLKVFAQDKFGSINLFAEAIGMKAPGLYDYFNDRSTPGGDLLKKLLKMGCDINWLLNDNEEPDVNSPPETVEALKAKNSQLEEENQRLRDTFGQINILTQAVVIKKNSQLKKRKR